VLVVVLVVRRVAASVVHVVDVITVRDRDVPAAFAMDMVVVLVHHVTGWLTFVVVILVSPMKVAVVRVVDVITVGDRDVAASVAVHMVVLDVGIVGLGCAGHHLSPPYSNVTHKLLTYTGLVRPGGHHSISRCRSIEGVSDS
jgi:hypothetical protein